MTVTGNQYRAGSVPRDMEALVTVLDTFMKRKSQVVNTHIEPCSYLTDEQVLEHAKNSANGERFMDYYNGEWQKYFDNQSDADMGFLSMLSFWCGCDEEQMDRIFRSSGMMRPKWDRKQAGTTYGGISIRNAVATCQQIYLPVECSQSCRPGRRVCRSGRREGESGGLPGGSIEGYDDAGRDEATLQSPLRKGRDWDRQCLCRFLFSYRPVQP